MCCILWDISSCGRLKCNRRLGGISPPPPWRARSQRESRRSACHLLSRWFLALLTFRPWRWRWYAAPKRRFTFSRVHCLISQKPVLFKHILILVQGARRSRYSCELTERHYVRLSPLFAAPFIFSKGILDDRIRAQRKRVRSADLCKPRTLRTCGSAASSDWMWAARLKPLSHRLTDGSAGNQGKLVRLVCASAGIPTGHIDQTLHRLNKTDSVQGFSAAHLPN